MLLTVTDTETGEVQRYTNPQKTKFEPILDTGAFATCDAPPLPQPDDAVIATYDLPFPQVPRRVEELDGFLDRLVDGTTRFLGFGDSGGADSRVTRGASSVCVEDATTLCLNGDRFKATVEWEKADGETGSGQAVELTDDTGYFWFFNDANVEVVVKALFGGCGLDEGHPLRNYWIFGAGLTDVEVDLVVEDTLTGNIQNYRNNQKTHFQPVQDTMAFPTRDAM